MPKEDSMRLPKQLVPAGLARTMSAQVASCSHALLQALESADIDQVRGVLQTTEKGLKRSALLMASYECRHALRTPLMCAVRTSNFAIFTTIMHAFNALFTAKTKRSAEMREQLLERDRDGWTVAMHAARAGHVLILESVINEIRECGATEALMAKDHQQMTLLMHAAASGSSAGFQEVFKAIDSVVSDAETAEHMALRSGDDQTLLMIAAASSDKMTFKACVEALRLALTPHDFRVLLKARDADGMTFLMHAANPKITYDDPSSCGIHDKTTSKQPSRAPVFPNASTRGRSGGAAPAQTGRSSPPPTLGVPPTGPDGASSAPSERGAEGGGGGESKHGDDQRGGGGGGGGGGGVDQGYYDDLDLSVSLSTSLPQHNLRKGAAKGSANQQQQQQQQQQPRPQQLIPTGIVMDPRVPVLKAAVALNKRYLWKEQVRDMLTAKDSWGRSLASHGILSASPQVFEVALDALRADVLDEEVEELVQDVEHFGNEKPLVIARAVGGKDMAATVQAKLRVLKRDVDLRAKASSFEAKIQSFIPGKLIVIFQLLLPEVGDRLVLLIIMSVLAPVVAWGSGLVMYRKTTADEFVPRLSFWSHALAAPAMFVWGIGTSNIWEEYMKDGEEEDDPSSESAVVLAVGAIVIPAVDGFVNSSRVEQWNDKFSLSRWRFSKQAEVRWKKLRAKAGKSSSNCPELFPKGKDAEIDDSLQPVVPTPVVAAKKTKPVPSNVPPAIAEHESPETKQTEEV